MERKYVLVALLALLTGAGLATASPIAFTESTVASGSLGGNSFADSLITLTVIGDTSNVENGGEGEGLWLLPVTGVSMNVASLGTTAILTDAAEVFSCLQTLCGEPVAGITDDVFGDILDTSEVSADRLLTSIGPATGPSTYQPGVGFGTDQGLFVINSAGDSTFTATLTPEPTGLGLFVLGLTSLAVIKRRR